MGCGSQGIAGGDRGSLATFPPPLKRGGLYLITPTSNERNGGFGQGAQLDHWANGLGTDWEGRGKRKLSSKPRQSPSSPRQANGTATPKVSASRSYKSVPGCNFRPTPRQLQGAIGREAARARELASFWVAVSFWAPDGLSPPSQVRSSSPPSLPPPWSSSSSSSSSFARPRIQPGGAGWLGAPPLPRLPPRPLKGPLGALRVGPRDDAAGRVELSSLARRRQPEQQRGGARPTAAASGRREARRAQEAIEPQERSRSRERRSRSSDQRGRGALQPSARQAGKEVRRRRRRRRRGQQQRRGQPTVLRGAPDAAGDGQRPRAAAHPVAERSLRGAAQDHPDAAVGQAEQDPDAQAGRPLHRLPLPGPAERRARLQDGQLQLCGPRAPQLRLLRLAHGGRLVHVRLPLAARAACPGRRPR